jgi:lipopolysaccharide transport system permease protein
VADQVLTFEAGTSPAKARHIRLQRSRGWAAFDLHELWTFRDLFIILAARDVKLRYRQTALGVIWVILQPLLASLIFAVIFGRLARLSSDGLPYLLFVYAGMLPWNFFSGALQRAGNSLISDSKLISKVYFPRVIVPIASTGAVLVDFLVAAAVMVVLLVAYRVPPTWQLLALPPLLVLLAIVAIGVSLWLSALNVYYRDFMYALPFVIQVWMYVSPLVYSGSTVPERWKPLYALNPLAGIIDGFRWSVLGGGAFPWLTLGVASLVCVLCFGSGVLVFRRVERTFADVV